MASGGRRGLGGGLGAGDAAGRTGVEASATARSRTAFSPKVFSGGREASVVFSGLAPFFAGLYQINARIPVELAPGRYGLSVSVGGVRGNEVARHTDERGAARALGDRVVPSGRTRGAIDARCGARRGAGAAGRGRLAQAHRKALDEIEDS